MRAIAPLVRDRAAGPGRGATARDAGPGHAEPAGPPVHTDPAGPSARAEPAGPPARAESSGQSAGASAEGPTGPAGIARYRALLEVAARLSTSFDRPALERTVVHAAASLSGADAVVLRAERGNLLKPVASSGIDGQTVKRLPAVPVGDVWMDEVLAAGRVWSCDDVLQLPPGRWQDPFGGRFAVRGTFFVPLVHGDRIIGSIGGATLAPRHWTDEDVEILGALGAHATLALRNAELFERLDARAAQMAVVQAASARMNRAKTVESVGRAIVEEIGAIVDYHNARVYIVEGNDSLAPIALAGTVGEYKIVDWDVLRVKVGEGFTGWVAQHGTALRIPDANADPRGVQIPGTFEVPESMLVVPMGHDDSVIGVITLSKLGLDQFDEDDLQVLTILADQAATALESARLLSRTASMTVELRRLLDMSSELSGTLDPRQVGALIARHLTVALGVDACAISSWDAGGDRIVSLGEYPERGLVASHPVYILAEYPATRRVLETKATVIVDAADPAADEAEVQILREQGYRLLAMIPLIAKGEAVGLVELMSADLIEFDEGRLALARTMANEAAMALENARLYVTARELADRDPLTGFLNHRALYERLGEEFVRARRARRPLSLLMLDIDDFKLVNDTFGHQFGDRCLVHLAEVVRSVLRVSDIPARYGGDEFAVILPEADAAAAAAVADRIAEELARSPLVADGRGPVPISASIGAASIGADMRAPADLVGSADARMYVAKAMGDGGSGPGTEPEAGGAVSTT